MATLFLKRVTRAHTNTILFSLSTHNFSGSVYFVLLQKNEGGRHVNKNTTEISLTEDFKLKICVTTTSTTKATD